MPFKPAAAALRCLLLGVGGTKSFSPGDNKEAADGTAVVVGAMKVVDDGIDARRAVLRRVRDRLRLRFRRVEVFVVAVNDAEELSFLIFEDVEGLDGDDWDGGKVLPLDRASCDRRRVRIGLVLGGVACISSSSIVATGVFVVTRPVRPRASRRERRIFG